MSMLDSLIDALERGDDVILAHPEGNYDCKFPHRDGIYGYHHGCRCIRCLRRGREDNTFKQNEREMKRRYTPRSRLIQTTTRRYQ